MKRILAYVLFCLIGVMISFAASGQEPFNGPKIATASRAFDTLPSDAGQFWMVYDISPYTSLYPSLPNPEQSLVNWILFDTGESFWHTEPFGVFQADRNTLRVYHTEKVQRYVSNILDRFMDPAHKNDLFTVRIITVTEPDWRTKAASSIRPYPAKAVGISCWTLEAADYAALTQSLGRRSDYVELNASRNVVPNTETFGWVLPSPKQTYVRDIQLSSTAPQGYVADTASIDEGYRIEVTPLLSTGGDLIEFFFSCQSTAVEKTHTFPLKVPTASSPRQQLTAEVPQIVSREIKDKISFPKDKILLLDLGMIPFAPETRSESAGIAGGLSKVIGAKPLWRNVLIFVQSGGTAQALPKSESPVGQ